MAEIIDFYQYKYSRSNYYLNLALTKDKIINISSETMNIFKTDDIYDIDGNKEEIQRVYLC